MKKAADLHSMPVEILRREIKKIAARINRCASMDELDQAWAIFGTGDQAILQAIQSD